MTIYTYDFISSNPAIHGSVVDTRYGRRVCFSGGANGAHDIEASDPERVRAHWDGYCENNGCIGMLSYREVVVEAQPATWGLPAPDPNAPHWGARAIYSDRERYVDLLPDRQGMGGAGTPAENKALITWVNTKGLPWLRAHCELSMNPPVGYKAEQVSVQGDGYRLVANTNASYGYLYIVAHACAEATEPTPKPMTKGDASRVRREMSRRISEETKLLRQQLKDGTFRG